MLLDRSNHARHIKWQMILILSTIAKIRISKFVEILSVILFIIYLVLIMPNSVRAWSYEEHLIISSDALNRSCNATISKSKSVKINMLCTQAAITCFGHYVAVAGDRTQRPQSLVPGNKYTRVLRNDGLDCSLLSHAKLPSELKGIKLEGGIRYWFEQAKLASANESHFYPDSIEMWESSLVHALDLASQNKDIQDVMALTAFSLHYLQDTFSVGHHGLVRKARDQRRHLAHHDAYNRLGAYLETDSGDKWFSYGDRRIDQPVSYLVLREFSSESFAKARDALGLAMNLRPRRRFEQREPQISSDDREIANYLQDVEKPFMIRLDSWGPLNKPTWVTTSRSLRALFVPSTNGLPNNCELTKDKSFTIARCSGEIVNWRIHKASEDVIQLVINTINGNVNSDDRKSEIERIRSNLPTRVYLANSYGDLNTNQTAVNSLLGGIWYSTTPFCYPDDICDRRNNPTRRFTDLTLGFIETLGRDTQVETFRIGYKVPFDGFQGPTTYDLDDYELPRFEVGIELTADDSESNFVQSLGGGISLGFFTPELVEPISQVFDGDWGGLWSLDFGVRAGLSEIYLPSRNTNASLVGGVSINLLYFAAYVEYSLGRVWYERGRFQDGVARKLEVGIKFTIN